MAEEQGRKSVGFQALIKKLEIKSLVSMDKAGRLLIEFRVTDDLVNKLNRLMKADEEVNIIIAGTAKKGGFPKDMGM